MIGRVQIRLKKNREVFTQSAMSTEPKPRGRMRLFAIDEMLFESLNN